MTAQRARRRPTGSRRVTAVLAAGTCTALVALLGACTGGTDDDGDGAPAAPSPTAAGRPPAAPEAGDCYRLGYAQAVSPTSNREPVACSEAHTAETYAVGRLDPEVDGHLLAVDSALVQTQVATECPAQVSEFLGGDEEALRLSLLQAVWFTPTLRQSDLGASWYRCDVVALAGAEELTEVTGSLEGVLGDAERRADFEMCGTAAPDAADFERVPCSGDHSWRAVAVVDFIAEDDYPGDEAAEERGQTPCQDAGAAAAEDPLDYEWSYEYPSEEQWDAGMTFGRCWVPEDPGSG